LLCASYLASGGNGLETQLVKRAEYGVLRELPDELDQSVREPHTLEQFEIKREEKRERPKFYHKVK
jgi:hypothetical protein